MIIYPSQTIPIDKAEAPLSDIYLFPVFQTREDVASVYSGEQLAKILPPPAPTRRLKYWIDPKYIGAEDDGEPVVYTVLHTDPRSGMPILDEHGRPRLRQMYMSKVEAGQFNIPYGKSANELPPNSIAVTLKPLPVPLRQLHPAEELHVAAGFGAVAGNVVVRNTKVSAKPQEPTGFTQADRELLRAIARALGVA